MAKCQYCGKDMLRAKGCIKIPIKHKGKFYNPVKVGDPGDWLCGWDENEKCTDCGAAMGHFHHPGCDQERCPVCGLQLIMCGCIDEEE